MEESATLVRLDSARRELARCTDLGDLKRIRDQATALQAYTRAQGLSVDLQSKAASIRIDAEARIGDLLIMLVSGPGRPGKSVGRPTDFSEEERRRFRALSRVGEPTRETIKAQLGPDATPTGVLRMARGQHKRGRASVIEDALISGPDVTADLTLLASSGAKFGTVYADPPWAYGNQGTRAATGQHYVTLSVEQIAALPVRDIVMPAAHLHLWTTNAFLFDAKTVLEAWGFEYKSCFVWVKPQMGIGNYWRVSHEFLLLGVRGQTPFRDRSLMSWGEFDRTEHSEKPSPVRMMVERASPGPYLELFGRQAIDRWTVFGNEVEPAQSHLFSGDLQQ